MEMSSPVIIEGIFSEFSLNNEGKSRKRCLNRRVPAGFRSGYPPNTSHRRYRLIQLAESRVRRKYLMLHMLTVKLKHRQNTE